MIRYDLMHKDQKCGIIVLDEKIDRIPYHNATSYDPNASLGGQMEKYWDLMHETPVLVQESYIVMMHMSGVQADTRSIL